MRKILLLLLTLGLIIGLTACAGGNTSEEVAETGNESAAAEEPADKTETDETKTNGGSSGNETLVVYFSATGNTKGVAETIASITGADTYDFDGKTMIPFCTSGGSGIGMSGKNLESNAGSGNWLDGDRLNGSASEEELQAWIDGLQ